MNNPEQNNDDVFEDIQFTNSEEDKEIVGKARRAVRAPIAQLSDAEYEACKGNYIAFLLEGPDAGKLIASVPLDIQNPDNSRKAVREKIAASEYKGMKYQVRPVYTDEQLQSMRESVQNQVGDDVTNDQITDTINKVSATLQELDDAGMTED